MTRLRPLEAPRSSPCTIRSPGAAATARRAAGAQEGTVASSATQGGSSGLLGRLRRRLLDIPDRATRVSERGFRVSDPAMRERLEAIGRSFVAGYRSALEVDEAVELDGPLSEVEATLRGFAVEGAAMALRIRDLLPFGGGGLLARFLAGPAAAHPYIAHVGVGWAHAKLRLAPERLPESLDPLLRWLAIDGHGFFHGYFHFRRRVDVPARWRGAHMDVGCLLDQGLGRSLWFVEGGDPGRIARSIDRFAPGRRPELWSGVGLASAYAGGAGDGPLADLRAAAGEAAAHLAQGACFGAEARARAGVVTPDCERATRVLADLDAAAAAELVNACRPRTEGERPAPAALYQSWRAAARAALPRGRG